MRIALGAVFVVLALAACGGGSSPQWKDLRSVTVTVAQPGLPPPFGRPRTKTFTSSQQLAHVTAALNGHHIAQASSTSARNGCAGGFQIAIVIVPRSGSPARLSAYRCANQTSGNARGDLVGFLSSVGVTL